MNYHIPDVESITTSDLYAKINTITKQDKRVASGKIENISTSSDVNLPIYSEGILETIGNTPLIKLSKVFPNLHFQLFAKLEMFNPGGSIKDRPAANMLKQALKRGDITSGSTVIESSSGNLGIGLAQASLILGLRFICVVDPKTTQQNLSILKAYGAKVEIVTEPDPKTGDFLPARISRVKSLLASIPNSFWPNQYVNLNNSEAHHQTMHEIVRDLNGELDYVFCTTGTCGTLRGCSEYIKANHLNTKIIAIDAKGSVIFGDKRAKRLIPGHGAAQVPALLEPGMENEHMHVTDQDCIIGCHRLLSREAILAGGSAGAAISAIKKKAPEIPTDANCVVILCDRGERYLDTIYSESWVSKNFGQIDW